MSRTKRSQRNRLVDGKNCRTPGRYKNIPLVSKRFEVGETVIRNQNCREHTTQSAEGK
jgi:hypothetical protein